MNQIASAPFNVNAPHALSADEALDRLQSQPGGLTAVEAAQRLAAVGPNRLPAPPREGPLKRFFKHFHDVLIYILLGAGVITALLGHWVDTGVILGVVVINAIIGFIQEGKAEQALEGIRKMLSLRAHVRRDGEWSEIGAETLVPGDLVRLRSGDRVPADLRLIEAVNLRIEESALTGESVPSEKNMEPTPADAGVGDRHGMAYSGTLVAAGRGAGVVTGTGTHTELGRINQMIAEVETLATPLTRQMAAFGKTLSVVILAMAVGMFLWRIAFVSLLIGGATIGVFLYEQQQGLALDTARTLAVNTLVVGQDFLSVQQPLPARIQFADRVSVRQPGGLADGRRAGGVATDLRLRALHARLVPHGPAGDPPLAGATGDRRGRLRRGRG